MKLDSHRSLVALQRGTIPLELQGAADLWGDKKALLELIVLEESLLGTYQAFHSFPVVRRLIDG